MLCIASILASPLVASPATTALPPAFIELYPLANFLLRSKSFPYALATFPVLLANPASVAERACAPFPAANNLAVRGRALRALVNAEPDNAAPAANPKFFTTPSHKKLAVKK